MINSKDDVQFHSEGFERVAHPAINVKVHDFPDAQDVAQYLKCSEEEAQDALEYAWETQCECFWDIVAADEVAKEYFGGGCTITSEGRSSGWVVVLGLPELESWDAVQLAKWRSFEKWVLQVKKDLCSVKSVCETIQINKWVEA